MERRVTARKSVTQHQFSAIASGMNIAEAKRLDLPEFLGRLGYEPTAERNGQLWYLSPFRHEKTPSFKINPELNAWYDFAEGKGGDILDFVKALQKVDTVSGALSCIRDVARSHKVPKQVQLPLARQTKSPSLVLDSIGPLRSKALLTYLTKRGISLPLAAGRVQEANYRSHGKKYFALAFENDAGGYELRNAFWKGTLGTKDITTIEGCNKDRAAVFEGFFDYLSAVTLNGGALEGTAIILNSVALRDRAARKLVSFRCQRVDLYRDNDSSGQAMLAYFDETLDECEVFDKAGMYAGQADLNAWLVSCSPSSQ